MSFYGNWKTATIGSGGTASTEVNLGDTTLTRSFDLLEIQIPTVDSCTLKVQTAEGTGGTFSDLGSAITTNTTTGAYNTVFKLGGWQYIKIVSSTAQGTVRTIRVRGMSF